MSDIFLTPADLTLLEAELRKCTNFDSPIRQAIREKLANARIVFPSDLPPGRVTTGARVKYRIDQRPPEDRVLTADVSAYPTGSALDVTTPCGVALLGQKEGDRVTVPDDSDPVTVTVLSVLYRPEGNWPRFAGRPGSGQRPVGAPFSSDSGPSSG